MIVLLLYDTAVEFRNKLFAWNSSVCLQLSGDQLQWPGFLSNIQWKNFLIKTSKVQFSISDLDRMVGENQYFVSWSCPSQTNTAVMCLFSYQHTCAHDLGSMSTRVLTKTLDTPEVLCPRMSLDSPPNTINPLQICCQSPSRNTHQDSVLDVYEYSQLQ